MGNKIEYICGSKVDILSTADDFYEAYKRCMEGRNEREENGIIKSDYVGIPAIVNGAFACELYLKSMNYSSRGHELIELYNKLDDIAREDIYRRTATKLNKESFDDCIKGLSNLFAHWRYIYEKENLGELGFQKTLKILPMFLEVFKEVAHENDIEANKNKH